MSIPDYYSILGISRSSSADEIKLAYRKLAMRTHPDVNNSPDANDKFIQISEAYAILGDENRRKMYHMKLARAARISASRTNRPQRPEGASGREYDAWVRQARENAREHAGMSYSDFKKTRFYRTEVKLYLFLQKFVFGFSILLAIFLMSIPFLLMLNVHWLLILLSVVSIPLGARLVREARKGLSILQSEYSND